MNTSLSGDALFEEVLPLFNALGDEVRQQIILLLSHHIRLSVGELTHKTNLSRPAVSHHIKVLREAGLVVEQKEGTKRYYQPTFSRYIVPMRQLIDCVQDWEQGYTNKNKETLHGK
jgi:ArsR family transcriptional regulator, arsenate/arsenite/antimonite-responsive transcriptional repressor